MDFAPGLSKLQDYVIEKNPNEPDPFIIRRVGIPHWLGGYEALDGIFVHSIGKSGNTPAVSESNVPKLGSVACLFMFSLAFPARTVSPLMTSKNGFRLLKRELVWSDIELETSLYKSTGCLLSSDVKSFNFERRKMLKY